MRLYLIGLPGAGKSVIGQELSQLIDLPFIDLDEAIVMKEKMSIPDIFATKGEDYFRKIEAEVLREKSVSAEFVMACGGGTPCFCENMKFINASGKSIFLNTPIPEIVKRIDSTNQKTRPVITTSSGETLEEKLASLLRKRLPFYQQAHLTLTAVTAADVADSIHFKK